MTRLVLCWECYEAYPIWYQCCPICNAPNPDYTIKGALQAAIDAGPAPDPEIKPRDELGLSSRDVRYRA